MTIRIIDKLVLSFIALVVICSQGLAQDLASLAEMMHGPSYSTKREMRLAMKQSLELSDRVHDAINVDPENSSAILHFAPPASDYQDESPSDRPPLALQRPNGDLGGTDSAFFDYFDQLPHDDNVRFSWTLPGGFTITPFGQLRAEMIYAQSPTTADAVIFFFSPENPGVDDDSFTVHGKTSMLNFAIAGPNICGWSSGGLILINFLGPQPLRNQSGFNVVNAYGYLENECYRISFGRMMDLFSPINPSVVNMGGHRAAGNVGIYRGGFGLDRWFYTNSGAKWTLSARASQNTVNDFLLLPTARGTDNGFPNFEGRIGVGLGPECKGQRAVELGISGLWGETRAFDPARFDEITNEIILLGLQQEVSTTAGMNLDFQFRAGRRGIRGEFWMAQAAGTYFAGILQTLNSETGRGIRSIGGWVEGYYEYSPCTTFYVGGGLDDPRNQDVGFTTNSINDPGQRTYNSVVWTTVNRKFTENFDMGLELSYRKTHYLNPGASSSGLVTHFSTTLRY